MVTFFLREYKIFNIYYNTFYKEEEEEEEEGVVGGTKVPLL
jgi:hypothetical protein